MLDAVRELASEFLRAEVEQPVHPRRDPDDLRNALDLSIGERGAPLEEVIGALRGVLEATPSTATRRFFNQLYGGRDDAATIAEMLTPISNTSMYTYKVAGPQVLVEQEVLRRLALVAGAPHAEGMFTPGGSMSNFAAMVIARNELIDNARDGGLDGRTLTAYASTEAHYSMPRAAGFIGIGRNSLHLAPVDGQGRMDPDRLAAMIERDKREGALPFMITATAGTTVQGAFDPIPELLPIAREHGCWLHVDGAYGASVLLSPSKRDLLRGVEEVDSLSWCLHKMMGVPLACSVILTRHRGALTRTFSENADYLFQQDDDDLNPGMRSMQCGRRNDALKLWASWKHHGEEGFAARVDALFDLAAYARERVESDPDLVLSCEPQSTNVCFEVRGKPSESICEALDRNGHLKIGYGVVNGRRVIRLTCVNPEITREDLDVFFWEIKRAAAGLRDADNTVTPEMRVRGVRQKSV
ncbi:MAG: aminotransferase class V-fold PLP-dependent enzyme [Phycisphaeraceae bacterium]|nr:aminotransferase class V-fold PLP-dependent enzyme [Phycisphaeraceae bacterium]